ncbi:MAG: glycerate kinase [Candidatus Competibacteraceae bacterium]|jgi:glycerate kinase|nr:glycerate kinase [Candidatus Competibacteraceae bacterium]
MRILIAPSGFKEGLGVEEVVDAIATGVLRALPDAIIQRAPLVDGGEGFTRSLVAATGGTVHHLTVTGPVGEPVHSHYGFLGGHGPKTAVLEMAAAAGLHLVPRDSRDPLCTTTYGVGQLIKAALDAGAERILVGCGDSGTNDGGAGAAQALGARLLDEVGADLGHGGRELSRLARIDLTSLDSRLNTVPIDVACNWHNVLCGPDGVARVFGPQKGASPEVVEQLAAALDRFAQVIDHDLGIDVRTMPGGGASGGLGAGLSSLLGATLHPRYDIVMQYLEFDKLLNAVDLVITAEGAIDFQTPRGKIPAEVARRAKQYGLPVIALAGTIGNNAEINFEHGIDTFSSILQKPCTLAEAIADTPALLAACAQRVLSAVMVGIKMANVQRSGWSLETADGR